MEKKKNIHCNIPKAYIGNENITCYSENSVIFAYGKGYTDFKELEEDHLKIKNNSFALLDVLKKNNKI